MAARAGCMDTVEWFLSDIPYQKYIEFSESDVGKEDARVKHLNNTRGGFDRAISKWLGMQSKCLMDGMDRKSWVANGLLR